MSIRIHIFTLLAACSLFHNDVEADFSNVEICNTGNAKAQVSLLYENPIGLNSSKWSLRGWYDIGPKTGTFRSCRKIPTLPGGKYYIGFRITGKPGMTKIMSSNPDTNTNSSFCIDPNKSFDVSNVSFGHVSKCNAPYVSGQFSMFGVARGTRAGYPISNREYTDTIDIELNIDSPVIPWGRKYSETEYSQMQKQLRKSQSQALAATVAAAPAVIKALGCTLVPESCDDHKKNSKEQSNNTSKAALTKTISFSEYANQHGIPLNPPGSKSQYLRVFNKSMGAAILISGHSNQTPGQGVINYKIYYNGLSTVGSCVENISIRNRSVSSNVSCEWTPMSKVYGANREYRSQLRAHGYQHISSASPAEKWVKKENSKAAYSYPVDDLCKIKRFGKNVVHINSFSQANKTFLIGLEEKLDPAIAPRIQLTLEVIRINNEGSIMRADRNSSSIYIPSAPREFRERHRIYRDETINYKNPTILGESCMPPPA